MQFFFSVLHDENWPLLQLHELCVKFTIGSTARFLLFLLTSCPLLVSYLLQISTKTIITSFAPQSGGTLWLKTLKKTQLQGDLLAASISSLTNDYPLGLLWFLLLLKHNFYCWITLVFQNDFGDGGTTVRMAVEGSTL